MVRDRGAAVVVKGNRRLKASVPWAAKQPMGDVWCWFCTRFSSGFLVLLVARKLEKSCRSYMILLWLYKLSCSTSFGTSNHFQPKRLPTARGAAGGFGALQVLLKQQLRSRLYLRCCVYDLDSQAEEVPATVLAQYALTLGGVVEVVGVWGIFVFMMFLVVKLVGWRKKHRKHGLLVV